MTDALKCNWSFRRPSHPKKVLPFAPVCLGLLILMLMGAGLGSPQPAFANEITPDRQIRIGIKSGSVTDATTVLTSTSGFKLGLIQGDGQFVETGAILPQNTLYVIKNTRTVGETIGSPGGNGATYFGPYQLQIGPVFQSFFEMRQFLDQNALLLQGLYPAFDDGWRVYTGHYLSEAERAVKQAEIMAVLPGLAVTPAPVNDKAILVVDLTSVHLYYDTADGAFAFMPQAQGDLIGFESRKYRGAIGIQRFSDSDPTVINYLGIEPYLYGVLPREMSGDWPLEALKAQAVAARNYAVANMNKHGKWGFDLCNLQDCQVYGGASVERPRSNDAVDETRGKLLVYNGKPITAFFHSNSGGRTENSENVWSAALPYLKAVEDPYSLGQPSATWTKTYTTAQLDAILKEKGIQIGPLMGVYVTKVSPNGRALETVFVGRDGEFVAVKERARYLLGTYDIRSTWYTVSGGSSAAGVTAGAGTAAPGSVAPGSAALLAESASGQRTLTTGSLVVEGASGQRTVSANPTMTFLTASGERTLTPMVSDTITFTGYGFGHGVGMSQWGAKAMADQGKTYVEILTHYYVNTQVQ